MSWSSFASAIPFSPRGRRWRDSSSRDGRPSGRPIGRDEIGRGGARAACVAAATLLAAGLSGCFQPMYGEAAHPGVVAEVRAIDVQTIDNRIGHYFVEDLRSALNGTGQLVTPKYRLTSKITTSQQTPTVDTQTQVASSATIIGDAEFSLVRLSDNKSLYTGTASAAAAYDRSAQRYADLRAARDAEIRLARDLADEISTRIAARLSDKP